MKLLKSVRNWFYAKYVKFVEMVTLYMIARSEKLVKKMIRLKGRDFVDAITPWMLNHTNSLVRQAIVFQGKDPDYVAPPPPPPEPIKDERYFPYDAMKAQATLSNFYSAKRPSWSTSSQDAWVRTPKLHPVLEARKQFAEKQAKLKTQLATVDPLMDEPEVLQVAASEEVTVEEGNNEESK